jgi:hypothetical protein
LQRGFEYLAADVFEYDVDPSWGKCAQSRADVLTLVIDSRVRIGLFDHPSAFLSAARDADDVAADRFSNLIAAEPVAPAAPETTTTSPALRAPASVSPK